MGFIDNEKWKEERLKRMDGALAEIETASGAFDELHDVADALENLGEGMDPGWMGYIFKTLGLRLRELAYISDEIKELVNKGLTVPEPKEDVFNELAQIGPNGSELLKMITGKQEKKEGKPKFIDGALTPEEWNKCYGYKPDEGGDGAVVYDSHTSGRVNET